MKMGLQLFSVRDITEKDLHGALEQVAALGYDRVEFAGFFGHPAQEVRGWLSELGLRVSGTHTGLEALEQDFAGVVAYHKAIGCDALIVPWSDPKT
ncbi:MAG: sugar phosphate isomerase/epimerase, partial [Clostridia bacterium]